ncbi:putative reverse transcriptase domain-containing protein [Tanacetum coccineum]
MGCKLETEGHKFDINLIPFGSRSFDVIIGMDWLSNHKAEIICHEKVVRIPLPDGKVLRVIRERPKEKVRLLMNAKAKEQKQEEIVVVRDFPKVFPDDLSGLSPIREIEFWIELVPGTIPIAKSPYRLEPSEMEELSGQLKELQDKGFIRPSSLPWEASVLFVKKKDGSFRMCIDYRELNKSGTTAMSAVEDIPRHGLAGVIVSSSRTSMIAKPWTFDQKKIELFSDYDCEIRYHPGKANVVADALSRKERVKPKSVPLKGDVRTLIMDEACKSNYFIYLGADKMYYDLRDRNDVSDLNSYYRDSSFTSRFWESIKSIRNLFRMRDGWDAHLPFVEFLYNNSYYSSVRCAPFEALYGRKCRSLIMWADFGEGVVRFEKKGKLAPRFVGPFEIIERIGPVAYRTCGNFEREFKKLKQSRIAIFKVRWNSKRGLEFMWERKDQMKLKYPHLFSSVSS